MIRERLSQVRQLLAPSPFRSSLKVAFSKPFATDKIDRF